MQRKGGLKKQKQKGAVRAGHDAGHERTHCNVSFIGEMKIQF